MFRTSCRLAWILIVLFLSQTAAAKKFAPGKLVKIQDPVLYPFDTLSVDSLIGRKYILLSSRFGTFSLRHFHLGHDSSALAREFWDDTDLDSILQTWNGKPFQILEAEEDTSYGGSLKDWYIRAKFSDMFKPVLRMDQGSLTRGKFGAVPEEVLDRARKRWQGKSLWMNFQTGDEKFPGLTHVTVLEINPGEDIKGSYGFHLRKDNGDTGTLYCQLQPPDTSRFSMGFTTAFGKLFLDGPPEQHWKTVPESNFEKEGVVLGQDSAHFFRAMKNRSVQLHSYDATYSQTGADSIFTAELQGHGVWGIPNDSSQAFFENGKLSALAFEIYDSVTMNDAFTELRKRFGEPSVIDSSPARLSMKFYTSTWYFYQSDGSVQTLSVADFGSELVSSASELKSMSLHMFNSLFMRGLIFYGDVPKETLGYYR